MVRVNSRERDVARGEERREMFSEDQLEMTGSIILGLIWTLLVSAVLFALAG